MTDNRVHCKFCDWSTIRFYKKTSAYERLKGHVITEHMDELEDLDDMLDEEFGEIDEGEEIIMDSCRPSSYVTLKRKKA